MMASSSKEKDDFFDASEEMSSESDGGVTSEADSEDCKSDIRDVGNAMNNFQYDFWVGNPKSIDERRDEFIRKTGFVLERCHTAREGPDHDANTAISHDSAEMSNVQEAANDSNVEEVLDEVDEVDNNGALLPRKVNQESEEEAEIANIKEEHCKEGWLKRFSFKAAKKLGKDRVTNNENKMCNCRKIFGTTSERVRVRSHKKWSKELSSLYKKQDILAHNGSILAVKFSIDGQYLATGGEDGTLNIWRVIENDKSPDFDLLNYSPAATSLFFSVNGASNLASFLKIKEEGNMMKKLKKSSDSACLMIPRNCFRILETPLHEFHGHEGDILDISWSKDGHLLSSSVDKTVRLWQVGRDECLKTFPHNDYVTCAQFNPIDDNYFISGSIDGIVRIWEVCSCQVVHWVDIKEIVTAICYRPDGKGGIVGSVAGNCSFFDITDEFLRPHPVICLQGKRTLTCKRITGFQFSPTNPREVVVSSADSQVRVLKGTDLIYKLRGSLPLIDRKSQIFASFSSDGKHIISATEECNVYVWNPHENEKMTSSKQGKPKNVWSCESFLSDNALIAVPWHGITPTSDAPHSSDNHSDEDLDHKSRLLSRDLCSTSNGYSSGSSSSSEVITRPSASVVLPSVGKFDYDFMRNVCESILSGSHLWGLVIVTGGKDGRIKTYQNYGLPVRYPKPKSLKSSFSFSAFRKRCTENCGKSGSSSFTDSLRSL